jgi:uncharacterized protein YcnI
MKTVGRQSPLIGVPKVTSTLRAFSRPAARRTVLGTAFAGALLALTALPASAHIVVTVPGGTNDGLGNLNFQVHNESDTATAVKVSVELPTKTPFAEVNPFVVQNWTITKSETTFDKPVKSGDFNLSKAVTQVTWTAKPGYEIPSGQLQNFMLNVGPFPETGTLEFPITVTLSDGTTVNWNEPAPADGSEAEHPTPSLDVSTIVAADMGMATPTPTASPSDNMASGDSSASSDNTVALAVGFSALAIAIVALIVAFMARKRPSA